MPGMVMTNMHPKVAVLYARSEDTPWQENIDDLTIDTVLLSLPGEGGHAVFRFTGIDDALLRTLAEFDLVFNLCYGFGQLDQVDVAEWLFHGERPHTGSNPASMRLAQDKQKLPMLASSVGVLTPPLLEPSEPLIDDLIYVRKPRYGSCHRGVIVATGARLSESLLHSDAEHILQPYIEGREFSVAVIPGVGGKGRECLPPVELKPDDGNPVFVPGRGPGRTIREFQPALSTRQRERLMHDALALHFRMGLGAMSRTDFRMDAQGVVYALDVNALPNLHPTKSLMPAICLHAGIDIPELLDRIVSFCLRPASKSLAK